MNTLRFSSHLVVTQFCLFALVPVLASTGKGADMITNLSSGLEPSGASGMKSGAPTRGSFAPTDRLSHADRHFLEKAEQVVRNDARLAQLAAERASDPRVKNLAEQMMLDHKRSNEELAMIASTKGVALSGQEREDHLFKSLCSKTGPDFDRKFVGHMIDDHDDTVSLFETAARSNDADVAAFATKTLATLEDHLSTERSLEASLKR